MHLQSLALIIEKKNDHQRWFPCNKGTFLKIKQWSCKFARIKNINVHFIFAAFISNFPNYYISLLISESLQPNEFRFRLYFVKNTIPIILLLKTFDCYRKVRICVLDVILMSNFQRKILFCNKNCWQICTYPLQRW